MRSIITDIFLYYFTSAEKQLLFHCSCHKYIVIETEMKYELGVFMKYDNLSAGFVLNGAT